MKAMLLRKQAPIEENPLEEVDVPTPEPGEGEILIRVLACGICHTDLHIVEGDIPLKKTPIIPGHQIVGTVEKRGPGVRAPEIGDRVGVGWLNWACGKCKFCLRGNENLCEKARFTGYDVDGGYAEFAVAPEAFSYLLPSHGPVGQQGPGSRGGPGGPGCPVVQRGPGAVQIAPLLCAGIVGYRALKLSGAERWDTLALYGFGASAHVMIQIALKRGIKVMVFSRSPDHRKLARKLGAFWAGTVEETPPHKPERAIIFAPAGDLVRHALGNIEKAGTVTLASIHMSAVPELNYEKHLYYEKKLQSVTASTRIDGRGLLREAMEAGVRTETQVFRLKDANTALRMLKESKINGAGVLEIGAELPGELPGTS